MVSIYQDFIVTIVVAVLIGSTSGFAGDDPLQAMLNQIREEDQATGVVAPSSGLASAIQSFNPDISVVIDSMVHSDDARRGIGRILEGTDGFGPVREPGGFDDGFNLREAELFLSSTVDPYFKAYTSIVVTEDEAVLEEAVVQTTGLPYGLQLKGGKFLSEFSRSNSQHPHDWDFVDRPLVSGLIFGDGGLVEKGAQLSWLAPTPFHLLLGTEVLQGENENMFGYLGRDDSDNALRDHGGPRLWLQWAKFSPRLPGHHETQFGLFHGYGRHQDEWDDGINDGWFDGHSRFLGTDFVYKYDAPYAYGKGDVTVQGEYIYREKDLNLKASQSSPALVGNSRLDQQDGLYLQGTYGFAPRWRAGLRWDHVGLTNRSRLPDRTTQRFGETHRLSAMVDFSPTEFSRLRLQVNRGEYFVDGDREDVYQVFFQALFTLGAHGAHKF